MVGHWFHWLSNFATTWLPLAFFGILILTAWLLFKTVGMMPRVRPSAIASRSRSQVTWSDVAGVEEERAELMEVVDFQRAPQRFQRRGMDRLAFDVLAGGRSDHTEPRALEGACIEGQGRKRGGRMGALARRVI